MTVGNDSIGILSEHPCRDLCGIYGAVSYRAIPDDTPVDMAERRSGRAYHGRVERTVLNRSFILARKHAVWTKKSAAFIVAVDIDELHVFDLAIGSNVSE